MGVANKSKAKGTRAEAAACISKILDGDSWNQYPGPIRGVDYPARRNSGGR